MASQTKPGPWRLKGTAGTAAPVPPVSAPQGSRLWFVDNLRIVLISAVVVVHLADTYGAFGGGWYQYHEPAPADLLTSAVLTIPAMISESFGLGFIFLLAGYFTPGSYDRKGAASFLRDRLVRLLIPLLLYDLLLDPLVVYIAGGRHGSYWGFYGPYLLHVRTMAPMVAWFIATLLLFTLLYVGWRGLTRSRPHAAERSSNLPSTRAIYGFIVALSLVSFVVRIWWPAGWMWQPFNLLVGYLPQHLSLYVLGCVAYRRNWFFELPTRMGRDWSLIALLASLLFAGGGAIYFKMGSTGAAGMQLDYSYFAGGFHWQAFLEAVWEAFLVVGACLGLLVLFRQRWNRQGKLAKGLAASAFTVYLIHPLVLVSVASAFSTVALYPLLKFVLAVLMVLPLSFLLSSLIRKLPLADRML